MYPLHFQSYGTGTPLIILHGLFGSSDNWFATAQTLAHSLKVFTLDARNHGASPHCDVMTYQLMARDVVEFMQRHGLESAVILGHSMGGKTAMVMADDYPDYVQKLVVVDIAPRAYPPRHLEMLSAMEKLELQTYTNRRELDQALKSAIPNPAIRQFLLKNVKRDAAGEFFWQLNLSALRDNYDNLNATTLPGSPITIPTCFIRGGKSDYILPEDEEHIHSHFTSATIETISNATHWVHADAPEAFVQLVRGFIG
ncbi:MAG: alpha/beta fold hydrolase [Lentisphaeria bacterium]|nr:alpha/beta fold hydrolase [Candidatus Neomarinimicrobiota bacterium]MCF7841798.1 alpha/beta fold hydrolase [Lentisphaeria bacterium]